MAVAVAQASGASGMELLEDALDAGGLWALVEQLRAQGGGSEGGPVVAIKPDLDATVADDPAATDPRLVERLIELLRARGVERVVVCDGRNRPDGWLYNRDALALPDLAGYRFEAPDGEPYDLSWVEDDPRTLPLSRFDTTAALRVDGAWVDADLRISFGSATTDESWGYALSVANLLGLVSASGAAARWAPRDRCLHLLRTAPPDFAVLDGVVSSHGSRGSESPKALATHTVVASPSALLVDWVGALKMGLDPHVSPLNGLALDRLGLPSAWHLASGDTAPWDGWENPHPTHLESTAARRLWPALDELAHAALRPTDRERFPFRSVLLDQLNARVSSALEALPSPSIQERATSALGWGAGWLARAWRALACTVNKSKIVRSVAPITLEVDALDSREFDATVAAVEGQARVLEGAPEDARGLRIRTVGGHLHFTATRVLPVDYDAFVEQVEIAGAIRYMNDYLGGSWAVLERDEQGRPLRQVERNVYLPQPNWVSAFGGREIDVEKVEILTYEEDRQTICWRTVRSPNDSADSDDGLVSFTRTPAGQVTVRIFARQRFTLPPAVASARVDRWPQLHGELASEAYGRFFDGTLANLMSAFRGEAYRIGREAPTPDQSSTGDEVQALLTGAMALLTRILGWAPTATAADPPSGAGEAAQLRSAEVDDDGFVHFPGVEAPAYIRAGGPWEGAGSSPLTPVTFWTELGEAVGRDLAAASATVIREAGSTRGPGVEGGERVPASGSGDRP